MNISHNGLGELVTTFPTDGSDISAGTLIKITGERAMAASEGNEIIGVAVDDSRNSRVAVQVGGYVKLKYTGNEDYGRKYIVAKTADSVQFCDASTQNAIPVKVLTINFVDNIAGVLI